MASMRRHTGHSAHRGNIHSIHHSYHLKLIFLRFHLFLAYACLIDTFVAKSGSIKAAAKELGIPDATLVARVRKLEEQLGVHFFEKNKSALSLTPAAEMLLPDAEQIQGFYRQLLRELNAAKDYYRRLRIAIVGSALSLNLEPFLDKLNFSFPNIRIELIDDRCFSIVDGLKSGNVDIYFAPVMESFDCGELGMCEVSASAQFVFTPRTHPLADRAMISIRELDREQFILYPETAEPAIRDFQLRNLRDAGIRYTLYDCGTSSIFYKLLVPIGKGLILWPAPMPDVPPESVSIPVTDIPNPSATAFFYDKQTDDPEVIAFVSDFPAFAKERENEHRKTV